MHTVALYINKWKHQLCFLFTIALSLVFLPFLCNTIVNGDEARTLIECGMDIRSIIAWSARDFHPPLYYILLHFVLRLTNGSIIAAKFLSLAPILITLFSGFFFLKKEFGYKTMLAWNILICFVPWMLRYHLTVRMYSLAIALVFFAALISYYIVKTDTTLAWVLFTLVSIACAYTHYYAFITACYLYGVLFFICIRKKDGRTWKKFAISASAAFVTYLPWLAQFLAQTHKVASGNFWAKQTNLLIILKETFDSHYQFSYLFWLLVLILFTAIGLYHNIRKNISAKNIWHLGLLLAFPIIFAAVYLFSLTATPIIVPRYLLIPLILLLLEIAIQMQSLNRILWIFPVAFFCFSGLQDYKFQSNLLALSSQNTGVSSIEQGALICTSSWSAKDVLNLLRPDLNVVYSKDQSIENMDASAFYIVDTHIRDDLEEYTSLIGQDNFIDNHFFVYYFEKN